VEDSLTVAIGDVVLVDEDRSITITGDSLRYERESDFYRMTGRPRFRKQSGQDIRISSRTMEFKSGERVADFISDVRMVADSLTILCQKCRYYDEEGRLIIEGEPIAFESNNILSGRRMEVGMEEEKMRWVRVIDEAEGLYLENGPAAADPSGQSWVRGDTLMMYLAEGRIERMRVTGNAESYYQPGEGDSTNAVNQAIGNVIVLDFENGEIARVFVKEHTEGTYLQAGKAKKEEEGRVTEG
jgi:hypothetical protein